MSRESRELPVAMHQRAGGFQQLVAHSLADGIYSVACVVLHLRPAASSAQLQAFKATTFKSGDPGVASVRVRVGAAFVNQATRLR